MGKSSILISYVKVICEGCIKIHNPECPACRGTRFYFWDPATCYCYSDNGEQMLFDDNGDLIPVVRQHASSVPDITAEAMLQFIELWVAETPVRKWKLLLDENGWQSCIWFNRYKHSCVQIAEKDFSLCIRRTYQEIDKIREQTGGA